MIECSFGARNKMTNAKRIVEEFTVTNPNSRNSFKQRFADTIRAREFELNMIRRGYVVTSKTVKARKYEISIDEWRDGKRPPSIDY
jgi:hypothetical protein